MRRLARTARSVLRPAYATVPFWRDAMDGTGAQLDVTWARAVLPRAVAEVP